MSEWQDVLTFWFGEPARSAPEFGMKLKRWFVGSPEVDQEIKERFAGVVEAALAGELDSWAADPHGRLALILLLDQFTRTLFRDSARQFAGDPRAQELTSEVFANPELEAAYTPVERSFLVMVYMHSEVPSLHEQTIPLMQKVAEDTEEALRPLMLPAIKQAEKYRDVIVKFGRFPHRNQALGRESTPAEKEFLETWVRLPAELRKG